MRQAILEHDAVRAVSFTGSNDVGSVLYGRGAERMIRVQCEMGGKNPVVVLADADFELAVEATAQGAFGSTGQRCTATSRVVVEERHRGPLRGGPGRAGRQAPRGQRLREGIDMGPAVDAAQLQTDLRYIEIGKAEGARWCAAEAGSSRATSAHGHFVEPTVFDRVTPHMRIAQEEIFGPVVSVIRVGLRGGHGGRQRRALRPVVVDLHQRREPAVPLRGRDRDRHRPHQQRHARRRGTAPLRRHQGHGGGAPGAGETAIEFFTEVKTVYVDYTGQSRKGASILMRGRSWRCS